MSEAKKEENSEQQNKDTKKVENSDQQKSSSELKDNELEDVSGGLFGITLIDECPWEFKFTSCMMSPFGRCPRLIVEDKKPRYPSYPSLGYEYVVTCSKGIFTKLEFFEVYDV
ncbi:MAG: hypothetical protein VB118_08885 [Oscillospiraceae bacterium]|nr:hypothetical protein [Oscillospiraceae bacterium]